MAGINNNLIPAKRGEVRNPNGRTKGVPNNKTRIRRLLEMTSSELNPITNMIGMILHKVDYAISTHNTRGISDVHRCYTSMELSSGSCNCSACL